MSEKRREEKEREERVRENRSEERRLCEDIRHLWTGVAPSVAGAAATHTGRSKLESVPTKGVIFISAKCKAYREHIDDTR